MVENSASYRARNPLVPSVNPTSTGLGVSAVLPAPAAVVSPPLTAQELAKLFLSKQPVERDTELRKLKQSQPDMYDQVYALLRKDVVESQAQPKPAAELQKRTTVTKQAGERSPQPNDKPAEQPVDPALLSKLAASAGVSNQSTP